MKIKLYMYVNIYAIYYKRDISENKFLYHTHNFHKKEKIRSVLCAKLEYTEYFLTLYVFNIHGKAALD